MPRSLLSRSRAPSATATASSSGEDQLPTFDDWSAEPSHTGTRLEDGRTLTWQEYGNHRGLPVLLIPDTGSSRLAPNWLLHESAMPTSMRLICFDRPGSGGSDPIADDGDLSAQAAEDLARVVRTLAVGRVVVIGIGIGASVALAFAQHKPALVLECLVVEPDIDGQPDQHRPPWARLLGRSGAQPSVAMRWAQACRGPLTEEQSWERGLSRMSERDRLALGDRYTDPTFRRHLADDLAEGDVAHTNFLPAHWLHESSSPVAVTCWTGTRQDELKQVASQRAGWSVVDATGEAPHLDDWELILSRAAKAYQAV